MFEKLKQWYRREKCFDQIDITMVVDRYYCKGVPGFGLCDGCKYRLKKCYHCEDWSKCTQPSATCTKHTQRMNHYEFPETDFECLKRIFTKAKLVTAFDEYEGMFDNKIIVFLNGNELHLWFDKNTGEVQEVNNDALSEEHMDKKYEIESDCAFDREYGKYFPTMYLCGCCHAKVNKTDTMCWHCRSKLYFKDLENDASSEVRS